MSKYYHYGNFHHHHHHRRRRYRLRRNEHRRIRMQKPTECLTIPYWTDCNMNNIFSSSGISWNSNEASRISKTHHTDRQTDRQTDRRTDGQKTRRFHYVFFTFHLTYKMRVPAALLFRAKLSEIRENIKSRHCPGLDRITAETKGIKAVSRCYRSCLRASLYVRLVLSFDWRD
jgi:hypothetical protein